MLRDAVLRMAPQREEQKALACEVGRAYASLGLLNLFVCDAKARGFLYRGMNLAASQSLAAGCGVEPADNVIVMRRVLKEIAQVLAEVVHGAGVHA